MEEVAWDKWVAEILPNEFRKAWDDANRLFSLLHTTMRDGLFDTLLPAAKRLYDIDTNRTRCVSIYAAVLIHSDEFELAEPLLRETLDKEGPSGDILYHLAILHEKRGNHTKAEETLLEALHVDPNHEESLDWWGAMQRVQGGEEEYVQAMKKIAQLEDAWRSQLHLAQQIIETGNIASALEQYGDLLSRFPDEPAIPMLISFDLGNAGFPEAVIDLLAERFDVNKDDPLTGANIIQAHVVLERFADAERLLKVLIELEEPEIHEDLLRYAQQIRRHGQESK